MSAKQPSKRGLLERLDAGPVICAESYLFELERRGYLQAGPFVPEVVIEHPEDQPSGAAYRQGCRRPQRLSDGRQYLQHQRVRGIRFENA